MTRRIHHTANAQRKPSRKITALLLLIAVTIGFAVGLGAFTFGYADGLSYFGDDSTSCANCHVMQRHLQAWTKSSHGKFTQCNDCHAPQAMAAKYFCKARNGIFHSLAFTTNRFPDRLSMHRYNRGVVEQNCRRCHAEFIHAMESLSVTGASQDASSCLHCHRHVGHDVL